MALTASKAADGKVVFLVEADDKQLNKDLDKVTNTIKTKSKEWGQTAKGEASIAQVAFSGLLETVAALGEAFGKLAVQFITDGIELAASIKEVDGTIESVFGKEGFQKIDEWSRSLVSTFGLTELNAKKFAASFGIIARQAGLADDEMISFSQDAAYFAADLASSIPGMSKETAFNAILSAFQGKGTALSKYGIDLSAAKMKEYAEGQGMKWTELSAEEQLRMRYEKMYETMQGLGWLDAFRKSKGTQQYSDAVISGLAENASAAVGKPLEGILSGVKSVITDIALSIAGAQAPINGTLEDWTKMLAALKTYQPEVLSMLDESIAPLGEKYGFRKEDYVDNGMYASYGDWVLQELQAGLPFQNKENYAEITAWMEILQPISDLSQDIDEQIQEAERNVKRLAEQDQAAQLQAQAKAEMDALISGYAAGIPGLESTLARIQALRESIANQQSTFTSGAYTFGVNGSHAAGLDYVPFNNYIASLHAGESILTAQEAKVWRSMKYGLGSTGFDYGLMGSAVGDHVRPGGNVYLDGQTVGRVISARQGDAYRAMERSGFQQ